MSLIRNSQATFTGGELAPSLHARTDLAKYRTGAKELTNWYIHPHGGVSRRNGLQFVDLVRDTTLATRLIAFEAASNDTYVLEFSPTAMRVFRNGVLVRYPVGHLSAGQVFLLSTPYQAWHLRELVFEQSNDVLTITHEAYAPVEIARYDHHDWRLTTLSFAPSLSGLPAPSIDANHSYTTPPAIGDTPDSGYVEETHRYAYTVVLATGEESSRSSSTAVSNDLRWYPSNYNTITWTAVAGALFYNVYKFNEGYYGLIGTTESNSFTDKNYKPNMQEAPPQGKNPFIGVGNYPRAVAYHQQRRLFGGTINRPQTTWGSVSAGFNNFSVARPAKDSDAIEFTIAARSLQKIRHYLSMADLLVFTESAEWRVRGTQDGILTPSSIKAEPQSYHGIGDVPPLVIGDQVLMVLRDGRQVRDLGYKFESDNYSGSDLTVLANHLFQGKRVLEWAHQKYPDSIIWCVMDDGSVNALTYMREHEVWGWARHVTDGTFESVAVVRENDVDVPYFVVARTIGGVPKRYVERITPVSATDRPTAFFVDCGLSYSGDPITAVGGLSHLEGRTVVGLADGAVVGRDGELVVAGGSVTLDRPASVIHLGLPYESRLETLSFTLGDRVTEGTIKAVGEVKVRVVNTSGIEIGVDFTDMGEHKAREWEDYGEAPSLFSGIITLAASADQDRKGAVCLRQSYPLPATVLSISPDIDYGA